MDNKALFKLSYGVFMLSTKAGDKVNGCITNTCMQVANSPTRVAISVINANYTCDLIKESGVFALSLLDETTTFETIKYFYIFWFFKCAYQCFWFFHACFSGIYRVDAKCFDTV